MESGEEKVKYPLNCTFLSTGNTAVMVDSSREKPTRLVKNQYKEPILKSQGILVLSKQYLASVYKLAEINSQLLGSSKQVKRGMPFVLSSTCASSLLRFGDLQSREKKLVLVRITGLKNAGFEEQK